MWMDGHFIPTSEARISVFDRGLAYGDGLFETMRVYSGVVFLLERHLERLYRSARFLDLDPGYTEGEIETAVYRLIEGNDVRDGRLKIIVTRGVSGAGLAYDRDRPAQVIVHAMELRVPSKKNYKLILSSVRHLSTSPLTRHKTLNCLENLLAYQESKHAGADEALMRNEADHITEGTVSNLFLVSAGTLRTPPLRSGLLPGITREVVLELARARGVAVEESELTLEDLRGVDELFLTNSIFEVMPVREIDGKQFSVPGPITEVLQQCYRSAVSDYLSRKVGSV
ncbi:MAG: aminotransferase class IV [Candidatus Bipolaricaulia bacterium]